MSSTPSSSCRRGSLFGDSGPPVLGERTDALVDAGDVVVERIVSAADNPPQDFVQAHDEWVALLRGEATVRLPEGDVDLTAGDWIHIPAHTPHRVERTTDGALWLAVHYPCKAVPA